MKDSHLHVYKDPMIARIMSVQQNYKGTAGDTAFLIRRCECGKGQAFDFGKTSTMNKLLKSLKGQVS